MVQRRVEHVSSADELEELTQDLLGLIDAYRPPKFEEEEDSDEEVHGDTLS